MVDRAFRIAVAQRDLWWNRGRGDGPAPGILELSERWNLVVYPPTGTLGIARTDDERLVWFGDAEPFFAGLPDTLDAEPLPTPPWLACLNGDVEPPTPERTLNLQWFRRNHAPTREIIELRNAYQALGWSFHVAQIVDYEGLPEQEDASVYVDSLLTY